MAKKAKQKIIKATKTSFYWLYFVAGAFCILLSLFFAPFWEEINKITENDIPWATWHAYALGIMLAIAIILYIFLVIVKEIKKKHQHRTVRIILALELSLMVVLAVCCILKAVLYDNPKFKFLNTCEIIGIVIWIRGVVEMIDAYYFDSKSKQNYPIWYLLFNILLVSAGPLVLVAGIKYKDSNPDLIVSYVFCTLLLFFGAFLCVWGGMSKPIKVVEEPIIDERIEEKETKEEVVDRKQNKKDKKVSKDVIDVEPILIEETKAIEGSKAIENDLNESDLEENSN